MRAGLPFGRVVALMGVDGHPASELRGFHAWLAVRLPEHADELIEADPYGVLTYGDAASLSPSSCAALIRALERSREPIHGFVRGAGNRGRSGRSRGLTWSTISHHPQQSRLGLRRPFGRDRCARARDALPEMLPDLEACLRGRPRLMPND